jgi:hypothetical protein
LPKSILPKFSNTSRPISIMVFSEYPNIRKISRTYFNN